MNVTAMPAEGQAAPREKRPDRVMTEERRAYLRSYQLRWITRRRDEWIAANGPCAICGSSERLEVDHADPSQKAMPPAKIWSLTAAKREAELAKCRVLCHECHKAKSKGESAVGEQVGTHALTEEAVRHIRASRESCNVLGSRFGVNKTTIARVRRGETWRHVV